MDGPALIHTAWLLCLVWIWAYRRYFEVVADRSPEFEAFCKGRPLLAGIATTPGAEAAIVARLQEAIGLRAEVTATLGVWPWPYHALKLELSAEPGLALVHIAGCRVLRTRERPLPALTDALLAAIDKAVTDSWLHPEAYTDGTGRVSPHGWRLVVHEGLKRPYEPRQSRPECWPVSTNRGSDQSAPELVRAEARALGSSGSVRLWETDPRIA